MNMNHLRLEDLGNSRTGRQLKLQQKMIQRRSSPQNTCPSGNEHPSMLFVASAKPKEIRESDSNAKTVIP